VVIGNAITSGNPEAEEVLNRRLYYLALPVVLKQFFLRGRKNLGVTGTHGKECRRDLAPAGASAAKKRYRGSFQ
jgi:UDP-N-acetylmuramate-alanine ligase